MSKFRSNIKVEKIDALNKYITNGTMLLQFGCLTPQDIKNNKDNRQKVFLQLDTTPKNLADHVIKKDYNEDLLQKLSSSTDLVTGFIVGPMTAVEIYYDPFLDHIADTLVNSSSTKLIVYDSKCMQDENYRQNNNFPRSFRVWTYNDYKKFRQVRYCESNQDCKSYEYCLCSSGEMNKSWCPNEKQICLPRAEYTNSIDKNIADGDLVNVKCIMDEIDGYKKKNDINFMSFQDIKYAGNKCSDRSNINPIPQDLSLKYYFKVDDVDPIWKGNEYIVKEGFGIPMQYNKTNMNIIIIILIIILILYICEFI